MGSETVEPFIGSVLQVAVVTKDLDETLRSFVTAGLGPFDVYSQDSSNALDQWYRGDESGYSIRFAITQVANMSWEIIQPVSGSNTYTEFLDAGGSGLHHIAVDCNDLPWDEKIAGLKERGYEVVQSGRAFSGIVPFAYLEGSDPGQPLIEIFDPPAGLDFADYAEGVYPPPAES